MTNAELRPLTLCPLSLGPAIGQPRVSWLTSAGGRTIVAEMSGSADTLREVVEGRYAAIPGLGTPAGHSPALSGDGRLVWQEQDTTRARPEFVLRMFEPATGRARELVRLATPLSGPAWGPNGEIAFIADQSGPEARLVVLRTPDANPRTVTRLRSDAVGLLWSPDGHFVVQRSAQSATESRALVLTRDGQQRGHIPTPWIVLGMTAEGTLVVARRDTRQVAALQGPQYDAPEDFGRLDVNVWAASFG